MRSCLLVIFLALHAWTLNISAEERTSEEPAPVLRARWSEDWSILRDPAPIDESSTSITPRFLRRLKFLPLNEEGDIYLSFGGEYRLAYELYDETGFDVSDVGYQDALQHRVALHSDLHLTRRWRAFAEFGYAQVNGREGGASAVDQTDIDVWQLFVDHRLPLGDKGRVVFRIGRQLIETGNVFITAGEANNIRLVYNGGRIAWLKDDFVPFEAFGAEYVDYASGTFDMSGTDEYFWGLRMGRRLEDLGWDLNGRQFEQGGANRHDELRHTVMLWVNRPLVGERQWGLDYYLAYQFGEYNDKPNESDISAFAVFGELRYAFFPAS